MNTDQLSSFVRSFLKAIGAALITHGATKAAAIFNAEDTVGLAVMLIGFVWSHFYHASDDTKTASKGAVGAWLLFALLPLGLLGCKTAQLETGGAYAPVVTNAAGDTVLATQPEQGLYVADAAYKLAYDTIYGVLKFERDNRVQVAGISPKIKQALDKVRPVVVDVEKRWALARKAYKENPTPAGLTAIQSILAEIQRLVPVAQAELAPVYSTITAAQ